MPGNVFVIGGGVAGLTAAHELSERGYKVTIYEARTERGGAQLVGASHHAAHEEGAR